MKPILILFVGFLSTTIAIKSYGQSIAAYSFGFIGNIGNKSSQYSGIVDIQGAECFMLSSGINTLLDMGTGDYVNNCEVNKSITDILSIAANPNPISTYSKIKLTKRQYFLNDEKVQLQLFNQKGYVVQQTTINLSQLNDGYDFHINNILNNGVYFLKLTNPYRLFKTLTLLKQD